MTFHRHRVLFIPELLDIIFNFLENHFNVVNACVCKQWSNIALNIVWKELELLPLLRLLEPTRSYLEDGFAYYGFVSPPDASDWSRFEKYAPRVRSLKFQMAPCKASLRPLLDDVARTRPSQTILPNLHTLEWIYSEPSRDMDRFKLFVHPGLRCLCIGLHFESDPRPDLYADLAALAPHLRTLVLHVGFLGESIQAELGVLLQSLPELEKIVLPDFHYTSTVIEELSRAKNITILDFDQTIRPGFGGPANVASFCPVLEEGAFPSLRELNLTARIDDLDRFFLSRHAPTDLTTLYVNSYVNHTPGQVHAFLTTLSQRCRCLSKLSLQLYHRTYSPILIVSQQLSYDTIKPVLAFPSLSTFELVHEYPLKITLAELEDLARQWPRLENLVLNVEPLFLCESACTLDLLAFLPFARHCPRLRCLGLYVGTTGAEIPWSAPLEPFKTLETLSVGTSLARDPGAVARVLSRMLPPWCTLEIGISWTQFGCDLDRALPRDLRYALQVRCSGWQTVDKMLPTLVQLMREEEACRMLRAEVEDLSVRNRLLMDGAHTRTRGSCVIG